jgi:hypothetical protein
VLAELRAACRHTVALRHTGWPPALPAPPNSRAPTWDAYVGYHEIPWSDLDAANEALAAFWLPLLIGAGDEADDAVWDISAWAWSTAG